MMTTICRITFLLCMFIAPIAFGQEASVWSLQDCIDHAMKNNLDIRLHQMEEARAGHDVTQSYANMFPSLRAGTHTRFEFGRGVDQVTNEFFTDRVVGQSMAATSSLNLFAGFRNINNIRYQLNRRTVMRLDTESMERSLTLTIANAYLQILYLEDMLDVAAEQLELARQQVEKTRILFEGGSVSRGNLLDMKAMAAEEETRYTRAENNLSMAYLELIYLLELDPAIDFRVERPDISVDDQQVIVDPELVVDRALQIEPSVNAARGRITMAENSLDIRRGERYPILSLNTELGSRYSDALKRMPDNQSNQLPIDGAIFGAKHPAAIMMDGNGPVPETVPYLDQLRENYYRAAQLSLTIPIFQNFQTRNRIQHARIDLDRAQVSYRQNKNQLTQIIHEAYSDAMGAYKNYQSSTSALEAARESYQHAAESFGLGISSSLEYNEARARLNRAEVSALQARYEFVFLMKILEFYQGEPFVL